MFNRNIYITNVKLQNRLKKIRDELNLSQSDLAQMVNVSRNTISSIETSRYSPTSKLALLICRALNKTFDEIFYLSFNEE